MRLSAPAYPKSIIYAPLQMKNAKRFNSTPSGLVERLSFDEKRSSVSRAENLFRKIEAGNVAVNRSWRESSKIEEAPAGVIETCRTIPCGFGRCYCIKSLNSMRRFFSRPALVLLSAMGSLGPAPRMVIRSAGVPALISQSFTA